jgi:hypothetical protein
VTRDDGTGSIRLEQVTQRSALPREGREFTAVQDEHAREAFPPDSLVSREGVARVIETMRVFEAVPAGMKIEPESVFDNRYVLKALGR